MNPDSIPFNLLVVGPTNSGKSRFVVEQLWGPFLGKFDYIVLIFPTFADNKTFHRVGEKDPRMFAVVCKQHEVDTWLRLVRFVYEGTNTLIVLDDCAASKDVKRAHGRAGRSRFIGAPHQHQRLGADPQVHQHHGFFSGKRRGGRSFLPACGENNDSHFRGLRRRHFPRGEQRLDRAVAKKKKKKKKKKEKKKTPSLFFRCVPVHCKVAHWGVSRQVPTHSV